MGKLVEDYILEQEIGAGNFGKVYKAFNIKNNEVVERIEENLFFELLFAEGTDISESRWVIVLIFIIFDFYFIQAEGNLTRIIYIFSIPFFLSILL